jgi:hypothetical protein
MLPKVQKFCQEKNDVKMDRFINIQQLKYRYINKFYYKKYITLLNVSFSEDLIILL